MHQSETPWRTTLRPQTESLPSSLKIPNLSSGRPHTAESDNARQNQIKVAELRLPPLPHHPTSGFDGASLALRAARRLSASLWSTSPGGSSKTRNTDTDLMPGNRCNAGAEQSHESLRGVPTVSIQASPRPLHGSQPQLSLGSLQTESKVRAISNLKSQIPPPIPSSLLQPTRQLPRRHRLLHHRLIPRTKLPHLLAPLTRKVPLLPRILY